MSEILKEVILCKDSQKQVEEIEQEYIKGLNFHYVDRMFEVLEIAIGLEKPKVNGNGVTKVKRVKAEA